MFFDVNKTFLVLKPFENEAKKKTKSHSSDKMTFLHTIHDGSLASNHTAPQ